MSHHHDVDASGNHGLIVLQNTGTVNSTFHQPDEKTRLLRQSKQCCKLLFLSDPYVDRERVKSAKGQLVKGTCEWIKTHDSYIEWSKPGSRRLWITGAPGRGKTMLAVYLTEEFERHRDEDGSGLVYFFFDYQDGNRNSASTFLRAALQQLMHMMPNLSRYASLPLTEDSTQKATLASQDALWSIFRKFLQDPDIGNVTFILDGIDECKDDSGVWLAEKLEALFDDHSSGSKLSLKLLIVSRATGLEVGMNFYPRLDLDTTKDRSIRKDLSLYIDSKITQLSRIKGFSGDYRRRFREKLLTRCEMSFLWLGFVATELVKSRTCVDLDRTLASLPKGLFPLYSRLLCQIKEDEPGDSYEVLKWVALAFRPITLLELSEALSIQPSRSITTEQKVHHRIVLCGDLIQIMDPMKGQLKPATVILAHQSLKEFLVEHGSFSKSKNQDNRHDLHLMEDWSHFEMARTCLVYLRCNFGKLIETGRTWDIKDRQQEQEYPLMEYATRFWGKHIERSASYADYLFLHFPQLFSDRSNLLQSWFGSYARHISTPIGTPKSNKLEYRVPSAHLIAFLGIKSWLYNVLPNNTLEHERFEIANLPDRDGLSPLHYAAREGKSDVVKTLLNWGAPPTDLMVFKTVSEGHEDALRILLNKGGNPNAVTRLNLTALGEAAGLGFESMVRLLHDKGADPNTIDAIGNMPAIGNAAMYGHDLIVKYLIPFTENAAACLSPIIILAIENDNKAMLQLLLDNMPDFDPHSTLAHCACSLAYMRNSKEMLKSLVDRGANLETTALTVDPGTDPSTPEGQRVKDITEARLHHTLSLLSRAINDSNPEMAIFLLKEGARLDPKSSLAKKALNLGTKTKCHELVAFLTDNGTS